LPTIAVGWAIETKSGRISDMRALVVGPADMTLLLHPRVWTIGPQWNIAPPTNPAGRPSMPSSTTRL
jgi:hypothetical protein